MKKSVAVVGAGVSGITTAVLLQQLNFDVFVYTKELPFSGSKNPSFASQYPSASVIPHSVYHPELIRIFKNSQTLFSSLHNAKYSGLEIHEHFELFAFNQQTPNYAKKIVGYKNISDLNWYPKHPSIEINSGWKFDCYFADWTMYYPALVQTFLDNKGIFINENVDLNLFENINEEIIINCSGMGSHELEPDTEPLVILGHLLKIDNPLPLSSPSNNPFSYNFSPGKDIYSDSFGNPFDVYFYPRKNDWILGGSRFNGTIDKKRNWISKDPLSSKFPNQIQSINTEILEHTFGINFDELGKIEYQEAYRYVRNTTDGLRVEKDLNSNRTLIHNYGHGGAGVTLSWGAAFEVLKLLSESNSVDTYSIEEIAKILGNISIKP